MPAPANAPRHVDRSTQPRALPPVHSATLIQDPAGVTLQLQADGGTTQVPLTLTALREIAALAGSALSCSALSERASPSRGAEVQPGRAFHGVAEAGGMAG